MSNIGFVVYPKAACMNLTTSFVEGSSYTFPDASITWIELFALLLLMSGTIHMLSMFCHPWSVGSFQTVSLTMFLSCTVTHFLYGWKIVVYPSANTFTLVSECFANEGSIYVTHALFCSYIICRIAICLFFQTWPFTVMTSLFEMSASLNPSVVLLK